MLLFLFPLVWQISFDQMHYVGFCQRQSVSYKCTFLSPCHTSAKLRFASRFVTGGKGGTRARRFVVAFVRIQIFLLTSTNLRWWPYTTLFHLWYLQVFTHSGIAKLRSTQDLQIFLHASTLSPRGDPGGSMGTRRRTCKKICNPCAPLKKRNLKVF